MLKVLVNVPFRDRYTGKVYKASEELILTKERVNEIRGISADLVTILGEVKETPKTEKKDKETSKTE